VGSPAHADRAGAVSTGYLGHGKAQAPSGCKTSTNEAPRAPSRHWFPATPRPHWYRMGPPSSAGSQKRPQRRRRVFSSGGALRPLSASFRGAVLGNGQSFSPSSGLGSILSLKQDLGRAKTKPKVSRHFLQEPGDQHPRRRPDCSVWCARCLVVVRPAGLSSMQTLGPWDFLGGSGGFLADLGKLLRHRPDIARPFTGRRRQNTRWPHGGGGGGRGGSDLGRGLLAWFPPDRCPRPHPLDFSGPVLIGGLLVFLACCSPSTPPLHSYMIVKLRAGGWWSRWMSVLLTWPMPIGPG